MIVKCLESLYKEKPVLNEQGEIVGLEEVLVHNNLITYLDIEEEDITAVKQHYNKNGRIYKDRCVINHRYLGNLIIKCTFEKMVEYRNSYKFKIKGFYNK